MQNQVVYLRKQAWGADLADQLEKDLQEKRRTHQDSKPINARVRNAERATGDAKAQLASAQQKAEAARAEADKHAATGPDRRGEIGDWAGISGERGLITGQQSEIRPRSEQISAELPALIKHQAFPQSRLNFCDQDRLSTIYQ